MDDLQSLSGRRAWASEETPLSFFQREIEHSMTLDRSQEEKPKVVVPLSLETEDQDDPVPATKTKVKTIEETVKHELVIRLSWDHIGQAVLGLLFLQFLYQMHVMSSRLAILEASLRR